MAPLASEQWAAGGVVAVVTFTRAHAFGDRLEQQFTGLIQGFRRLRGRKEWVALAPEEWVYRMHVTHGPNGPHAHLHVLLFLGREWAALESVQASRLLEAALSVGWDGRVGAKLAGSMRQVLYPWQDDWLEAPWADDWLDPDRWEGFDWSDPAFPAEVPWLDEPDLEEVPEWWSPELSLRGWRRGLSTWELAALARSGDKRAYHYWIELHHASRKHRLTQCSPGVNRRHRARVQRQKRELALRCLVQAWLWNKAQFRPKRFGGPCMERALWVGRRRGVEAMAEFLSRELMYPVVVCRPRGSPAPVLVCPIAGNSSSLGGRT